MAKNHNHQEHLVWLRVWQLYMWVGMALLASGGVLFLYGLLNKELDARGSGLALVGLGVVFVVLSTVGLQKSKHHVKQLKKSTRSRK